MTKETGKDEVRGEPIVVEFTPADSEAEPMYFIGASLEAVMADTDQGRKFGGYEYSSHRVLTLEDAEVLDLGHLRQGLSSVMIGPQRSYMLGQPGTGYKSFQDFLEQNFLGFGEIADELLKRAKRV
tara:strand:+ start:377 stop:754 length:378 start_codon:yes stop_codon:yes gene_type:complete